MTSQETKLVLDRLGRHEERFDKRLDALGEDVRKVSTDLVRHVAAAEAGGELTQAIRTAVFGNGKDGFVLRVDRLERWKRRIQYAMTAVVVPLVVYVGYTIIRVVIE